MQTHTQTHPVNVLSIDGGGIRGLIPAMFLAAIEERTGKRISELFDMMAGTSTGGILALALARPAEPGSSEPAFKASDLIRLYEENGEKIFSQDLFRQFRTLGGMTEEKYSAHGLETLLSQYFGEIRLKDALNDLLITSYDIENRTPFNFKSSLARVLPDYDFPMKHIARATSAAPTYFEPAYVPAGENGADHWALIDGGVFANNPALLAYTEAVRGRERKKICLVSIGTGHMTKPLDYDEAKGWGAAQWVRPIIDVVFDGVSDSVDEILSKLLTYEHDYYRFQVQLRGVDEEMDNVEKENLQMLKELAHGEIYPTVDQRGAPALSEKLCEACDQLLINKFYPYSEKDVGKACGISYQKTRALIQELGLDQDGTLTFIRHFTVTRSESGIREEEQEWWYSDKMIDRLQAALSG